MTKLWLVLALLVACNGKTEGTDTDTDADADTDSDADSDTDTDTDTDTDPVDTDTDPADTDTDVEDTDTDIDPNDVDGDGYPTNVDCDDADDASYPGAPELCDAKDNDCDETVDEDATGTIPYYHDADDDNYGVGAPDYSCLVPTSYNVALNADDCNDFDAAVHPFGGDTLGDNVDGDCDTLDCAANYSGGTYFAVCAEENVTFSGGENLCLAAGYDGLASILTADENTAVAGFAFTLLGANLGSVWIGGEDNAIEGQYVWTNGSAFTYTNWNTIGGEPDGADAAMEDCVRLNALGLWADDVCTVQLDGYTCEIR